MPSGAVPVALDGLGVERADNVKVLSQPAEEGGGEGGGWDEGSGLEVWNVQTWRGTAACGVWTLRGYDDVCTAICCASQLLVNELSSGPQISLLPHTSSPPPPLNPPSLPSGMTVSVCCQQMSFPPARRCFWWCRRTRGARCPTQRAGSAGEEGELALTVRNIRCVFVCSSGLQVAGGGGIHELPGRFESN